MERLREDAAAHMAPPGGCVYSPHTGGLNAYNAVLWFAARSFYQKLSEEMGERAAPHPRPAWMRPAIQYNSNVLFKAVMSGDQKLSDVRLQASEFAGQWMADLLGKPLGSLLDDLGPMLDNLLPLLDRASSFGPPTLIGRNGELPEGAEIWPGHSAAYLSALYIGRGRAEEGMKLLERLDRLVVQNGRAPWQAPQAFDARSGRPLRGFAHASRMSSWTAVPALDGFGIDVGSGSLTLQPELPRGTAALAAPVFTPILNGWIEYRPGPRRTRLSFRLDRYMPAPAAPDGAGAFGLAIRRVALPASARSRETIIASVGRAPIPGKASRDAGSRWFTFDSELRLTTGQRLEFDMR
jgi:hypothetical protein